MTWVTESWPHVTAVLRECDEGETVYRTWMERLQLQIHLHKGKTYRRKLVGLGCYFTDLSEADGQSWSDQGPLLGSSWVKFGTSNLQAAPVLELQMGTLVQDSFAITWAHIILLYIPINFLFRSLGPTEYACFRTLKAFWSIGLCLKYKRNY